MNYYNKKKGVRMTDNNEILDEILDELRTIRWHILVVSGALGAIFGVLVMK